jgi:NAD(P)H-dependent FMN reductase
VDLYSLSEMPPEIFDPSSYAKKPEAWLAVQERVVAADGLHIVTPEYNGGFPGVLKYFIDMLKFPESFEGKPVAFTGEAAGMWGAIRPVEQLQQIFGYRNAHLYPDRVFIPGITGKLNDADQLTDPAIDERLKKQATGFAAFVQRLKQG